MTLSVVLFRGITQGDPLASPSPERDLLLYVQGVSSLETSQAEFWEHSVVQTLRDLQLVLLILSKESQGGEHLSPPLLSCYNHVLSQQGGMQTHCLSQTSDSHESSTFLIAKHSLSEDLKKNVSLKISS